MPGVLLDHVHHDPAHAVLLAEPVEIVECGVRQDRPRQFDLAFPGGERFVERVGGTDVEVAVVVLVGVVDRRRVLTRDAAAEPAPLDLGHVPHEAHDGELAGRTGGGAGGRVVEAFGLPAEHGAVVVQELVEDHPFGCRW